MAFTITRVTSAADLEQYKVSLRTLLQACVNPDPSTSSIGFLAPLSDQEADEFWLSVGSALDSRPTSRYVFVITSPDPALGTPETDTDTKHDILATVQLHAVPKATHAHRAEVAKLLVRPEARRLGLARKLMDHLEAFARDELGMLMLTLDTKSTTPARVFYNKTGWTEWGTCPDYAAYADGRLGSATFFIKYLK